MIHCWAASRWLRESPALVVLEQWTLWFNGSHCSIELNLVFILKCELSAVKGISRELWWLCCKKKADLVE